MAEWSIENGETAAEQAAREGVVGRGKAGVSRFHSPQVDQQQLKVQGNILCHDCLATISFTLRGLLISFQGAGDLRCPACGIRIGYGHAARGEGERIIFLYVTPQERTAGRFNAPFPVIKVTNVGPPSDDEKTKGGNLIWELHRADGHSAEAPSSKAAGGSPVNVALPKTVAGPAVEVPAPKTTAGPTVEVPSPKTTASPSVEAPSRKPWWKFW